MLGQCRTKFRNIIRVELEKRKRENRNANEAKDLMDELMHMKDEEGKNLIDEEVLDNIVNSIHIGYISTATLSTWTLYFIAKDPNVLRKLRVCDFPPQYLAFIHVQMHLHNDTRE